MTSKPEINASATDHHKTIERVLQAVRAKYAPDGVTVSKTGMTSIVDGLVMTSMMNPDPAEEKEKKV